MNGLSDFFGSLPLVGTILLFFAFFSLVFVSSVLISHASISLQKIFNLKSAFLTGVLLGIIGCIPEFCIGFTTTFTQHNGYIYAVGDLSGGIMVDIFCLAICIFIYFKYIDKSKNSILNIINVGALLLDFILILVALLVPGNTYLVGACNVLGIILVLVYFTTSFFMSKIKLKDKNFSKVNEIRRQSALTKFYKKFDQFSKTQILLLFISISFVLMLSSFMISFNGSDIIHRITNANNGGSGSYFASIIFSFVTSSVEIIVTFTLLRSYKINTAISEITGSCLVNSFVLGLLGFIFSFTNKNGGEFYGEESTRLLTICLVISLVLMLIFLFSWWLFSHKKEKMQKLLHIDEKKLSKLFNVSSMCILALSASTYIIYIILGALNI